LSIPSLEGVRAMKKILTLFLLLFLILVISSEGAGSIELRKGSSKYSLNDDFLKVSVRLIGGKGAVVRKGRSIGFTLQVNEDAYVVVYNIDSDGYIHLLFPYDGKLKRLEARRIYYFPERESSFEWIATGNTGIEYIHAVAVRDRDRINENELYYLAKNDELPEEKRFKIDTDPFTAFNFIVEELITDAESAPPATDYTYFYINKRVDYPRYLCYRCHNERKITDPYRQECPEVVIEQINYDEISYPYQPLFEVTHTSDSDYYENDSYAEKRYEGYDKDYNHTNVYLSIFYTDYDYPYRFYWPAFRTYIVGVNYPIWWDYFWWDFGWTLYWSDYYYYYYPFYTWWTPYYSYWVYRYRYDWWDCYYCVPYYYPHRSIYAARRVKKRTFDYRRAYTTLHREKVLANSRLVKTKTPRLASRIERSSLKRKMKQSPGYTRARYTSRKSKYDRNVIRGKRTVYSPASYRAKSARSARTTRKSRSTRTPELRKNPESRKTFRSGRTTRTKLYDDKRTKKSRAIRTRAIRSKSSKESKKSRRTEKKSYRPSSFNKSSTYKRTSSWRTTPKSKTETRTISPKTSKSINLPSRSSSPSRANTSRPVKTKRR